MSFHKIYDQFSNREERAQFIARFFKSELAASASVLDVGCDINSLKKTVGSKVTGVDLYGDPDFRVDFEKEKLSRFKDGEFDLVVCTEVLEHLDNLYEMIDEIHRVSNKYIIISLPNCLDLFTRLNVLFFGKVGKFYGLPFQKPEDRHRWFFSHRDLDAFFRNYAQKNNLAITKKFLQCNYSNTWKGKLVRGAIKLFDLDIASQSYWILLEKK